MKSFEIINTRSGHSFGTWEAESAEAALDSYASDAGYQDFADACKVASGDDIEAREVEETAAMETRRNRVRRAIQVSAAFTRIEHMDAEGADVDGLVADFAAMWAGETDSVENGEVTEVWGWSEKTPPNEHAWRVHIHH